MSSLNVPDQVDTPPDVNVSIQSSRICQLVFRRGNTEDRLQVARLPKDPSLGGQSISTKGPELGQHTHIHRSASANTEVNVTNKQTNLDVFDSTCDQSTVLNWIPGNVKDLQEKH